MTNSLYEQVTAMQNKQNGQNSQQNLQQAFDDFMLQNQGKTPQQVLQEHGIQLPAAINAMGMLKQMFGGR